MVWPCPGSRVKARVVCDQVGGRVLHPDPQVRKSPITRTSSYLGCTLFKTLDDFLFANSELERFVSVSG